MTIARLIALASIVISLGAVAIAVAVALFLRMIDRALTDAHL